MGCNRTLATALWVPLTHATKQRVWTPNPMFMVINCRKYRKMSQHVMTLFLGGPSPSRQPLFVFDDLRYPNLLFLALLVNPRRTTENKEGFSPQRGRKWRIRVALQFSNGRSQCCQSRILFVTRLPAIPLSISMFNVNRGHSIGNPHFLSSQEFRPRKLLSKQVASYTLCRNELKNKTIRSQQSKIARTGGSTKGQAKRYEVDEDSDDGAMKAST